MTKKIPKLLLALFATILVGCALHRAEDELWLIPKGHVGWLVVIPNRPDGVEKEYEDGRLVFRFPRSGVLKTKFPLNYGVSGPVRYMEFQDDGTRTPIFYTYNGSDLDKIGNGEPYLFFGFTASRRPFPYPEFFAIVMKIKGNENQTVIPPVDDFLLDYSRKEEKSNQSLQPTQTAGPRG